MIDFEEERRNMGDGWQPLIEKLHADLLAVDPNYRIEQIKEKFGGLRYYVSTDTDKIAELNDLIDVAETKTFATCEWCGNPGKPRGGGWVKTLCDPCNVVKEERRKLNGTR